MKTKKSSNPISKELIAPCGMNCALCCRYLAFKNNLKRSQCPGCRPRNIKCSYLYVKCSGINHDVLTGKAMFCTECDLYPCKPLSRMNERYQANYRMSMIHNLERIKKAGIDTFIYDQYDDYHCKKCGELISVHNGKCFTCDTITRLVEKSDKPFHPKKKTRVSGSITRQGKNAND